MKKGFIGLGSQGAPMAQRMIDGGYEVVLWARRQESLEPFQESGAVFADSIASLGEQVDHCGICVVDDAGVKQVCDELMPAMAAGGSIAIHSTIHPELCKTLEQEAQKHQLLLVDAPVSGGAPAAAAGKLTVMVGGSSEAFDRMQPIFATFSGLLVHLGGIGAGQLAKLVNNSMMAANMAIAHHSLVAAKALGVDPEAFIGLVKESSGRSFAFDVCAKLTQPSDFSHGAKMLNKDVGLLGEALADSTLYEPIKNAANPFLELALKDLK